MRLDLASPHATAQAALEIALTLAPADTEPAPPPYSSAWRRAALAEAIERQSCADERYAPSPRSTRGATRA